jgi:hypothetical protein
MTAERIRRAQEEIGTLLPQRDEYVISTSEFDEVKSRVASSTVGVRSLVNLDISKPTLRRGSKDQPVDRPESDKPTLQRR